MVFSICHQVLTVVISWASIGAVGELWVMTDHRKTCHVCDISQSTCASLYINLSVFPGFYVSTLISVSAWKRPSRFINFSNISELLNTVHYANYITYEYIPRMLSKFSSVKCIYLQRSLFSFKSLNQLPV